MIDKLVEGIKKTGAPITVGLDPTLKLIPEQILKKHFEAQGETPEAVAEAMVEYNKGIIDAVCDIVPAVKPQIAMYEGFGLAGLTAFQKTISYAHEKGLVVIGDIKRGDIGITSELYAQAHIGRIKLGGASFPGFDEDFTTVNPYMGSDSVRPFMKIAAEEGKGIFVLVKTSNPSSGEFQDKEIDGRPLYKLVGEQVAAWGEELMGECGYSAVGAVVGATYPEQGKILRRVMPKTFILVPGYGAQGGKGADLKWFFNKDGLGAIVNSSRGIIGAWQQEKYAQYGAEGYADAARAATLDMKEDIAAAIG